MFMKFEKQAKIILIIKTYQGKQMWKLWKNILKYIVFW